MSQGSPGFFYWDRVFQNQDLGAGCDTGVGGFCVRCSLWTELGVYTVCLCMLCVCAHVCICIRVCVHADLHLFSFLSVSVSLRWNQELYQHLRSQFHSTALTVIFSLSMLVTPSPAVRGGAPFLLL